jgi:MFS family permease
VEQKFLNHFDSQPPRYGALTLVTTSLAVFFTSFMTSGINVAVPNIGNEFHANAVLLGWLVNSFFLLLSVFLVPFGRLADIIGLKRVFLWGVITFTIVSAVTLFANSIIMVIICRSLQGIGCAMIFSTGTALVTATHDITTRGRALGISTASVYVGYSAGPALGGILTDSFGWRSMFAIIVPV